MSRGDHPADVVRMPRRAATPRSDLEMQRALLAGMWAQPAIARAVPQAGLTVDHFDSPGSRLLFQILTDHASTSDVMLQLIVLRARLGGHNDVLGELPSASTIVDTDQAVQIAQEIVAQHANRDAEAILRAAAAAAGSGDTEDMLLHVDRARAAVKAAAAPTWPEPEPLPELPTVPAFDLALLPDALRDWIADISQRQSSPIEYAATTALAAAGSVIGCGVGIRPKQHDNWTITPNLWAMCIGLPSAMKSPAMTAALKPLGQLVARAREDFEARTFERKAIAAQLKGLDAQMEQRAKKGENLEILRTEYEDLKRQEAESCFERRYVTSDATTEKIGELLNQNPRGILVMRDELEGWLGGLEREGHQQDRAFYLEAWNGTGSFVYDRIGRGTVRIEHACISVVGAIQPGPLSRLVSGAVSGGNGADGLLQRFSLAVWPDLRPYVHVDRVPSKEARERALAVFERLSMLAPEDVGAQVDEHEEIPYLRFDAQAQSRFDAWYVGLMQRARSGELHEALESHLLKQAKLVPALALIFHLADGEHGPVGIAALLRALAWADLLEQHAGRIYACGSAGEHSAARTLLARLRTGKLGARFSVREIAKRGWTGLADHEAVRAAVSSLELHGWLRTTITPTAGRPKEEIELHPSVVAEWSEAE